MAATMSAPSAHIEQRRENASHEQDVSNHGGCSRFSNCADDRCLYHSSLLFSALNYVPRGTDRSVISTTGLTKSGVSLKVRIGKPRYRLSDEQTAK